MAISKPQYPMSNKNGYFYPVTTADQILLSDGTRLEKNGQVVSQDSAKLGGKASGYYLQQRNLLDNSDFEIAQAGYNNYHGNDLYHADRWFGNNLGTLSISGKVKTFTSVSGFAYMRQTLWNDGRDHGKTYTLVVTLSDGTRMVGSGTSPAAASTSENVFIDITAPDNRCWVMAMKITDDAMCVRIDASQVGASISFLSIDLFEGAYTAESAPSHVPKGYSVELDECRRYYRQSYVGSTIPHYLQAIMIKSASTSFLCTVNFDTPMYKTPTLILYGAISKQAGCITRWTDDVDISGLSVNVSPTNFIIQKQSAFDTSNGYYFHYTLSADI